MRQGIRLRGCSNKDVKRTVVIVYVVDAAAAIVVCSCCFQRYWYCSNYCCCCLLLLLFVCSLLSMVLSLLLLLLMLLLLLVLLFSVAFMSKSVISTSVGIQHTPSPCRFFVSLRATAPGVTQKHILERRTAWADYLSRRRFDAVLQSIHTGARKT